MISTSCPHCGHEWRGPRRSCPNCHALLEKPAVATTAVIPLTPRHSIGKAKAIALAKSRWWEGQTEHDLVTFQLFTEELAMPFSVFHEALEKALKRPVFTHELALNYDGIVGEFLGVCKAPTLEEILSLIPADKRIILLSDPNEGLSHE